jgi:hypothetical protein
MDHHSHRVLDVLLREVLWVGESSDGSGGVVVSTFTDHPPRTGGTEIDEGEEGDDPDPLEDEGQAPGEVCGDDERGFDHTAGEEDSWLLLAALPVPARRRHIPIPQHMLTYAVR